ncbi:arylalkylamine N-acetyltransferase 1-like [Daphnia carinata]|uniref:arylalkylamine N-acetyltransferase 1-like n=1 Tax=Daphnia carinata TaxID=120202 RepID=UPI00257CD594|nr:arylalkylamine N-acetyltransferase 1-like [Daphnia carinata]
MGGQSTLTFPLQLERAVERQQELTVYIAQPDDGQEIFEFLLQHFFPLAPIRQLALYDESEEAKRPEWVDDIVRECVQAPYSLLVRDACLHNQIVAVAINDMKKRTSTHGANHQLYAPKSNNPAQIPVGRLHKAVLEDINRDVDIFAIFQTEIKMEIGALAVDGRYTRQGLATRLVELSLRIAKAHGAGAVWTEALSAYTAKAVSKLGFDVLKSVTYDDFRYEGELPLANIPGHSVGRLMARKI